MKDENIKEILDRAKNLKYKCDCCEEIAPGKYIMKDDKQTDNLIEAVYIIDKLLDYITNLQTIEQQYSAILSENAELENKITNLQEENERLKEDIETISASHFSVFKRYDNYKSRIDKAIEYIMTELITEWNIENGGCVSGSDLPVDVIIPLLDILKGSDNYGKDEF